ncbi:hypothetical protein ACQ4M4_23795 [Leptolyngbya sp. AN02str]|uniref:hypothetical protein n=1 Tax=Leptolyngbya sp. AN02str TaxID=3423363 RepID=UPI003D3130E2
MVSIPPTVRNCSLNGEELPFSSASSASSAINDASLGNGVVQNTLARAKAFCKKLLFWRYGYYPASNYKF